MITTALCVLLAPPPKPVWTGTAAGYRLEKWSHIEPHPDQYKATIETFYIRDRQGKIVTAVKDYSVSPLFPGQYVPAEVLRPFRLAGILDPLILFQTWSGGAHGSNCFFLWSLGRHPRCLLAYDKNNMGDDDFHFVYLGRQRTPEIRSWYDGFAYMLGGAYSACDIPVVLRYEHGRYVDRTEEYPRLLRQAEHRCWVEMQADDLQVSLPRHSDDEGNPGPLSPAVNLIALGDLLNERPRIWGRLKHTLPRETYLWLRHREPTIRRIVRLRTRRYLYPAPFHSWPVTFRPFPTDKDGTVFGQTP